MKNCKKYLKKSGWVIKIKNIPYLGVAIYTGVDNRIYYVAKGKREVGRAIRNYTRKCKEWNELSDWMDKWITNKDEQKIKK